MILTHQQRQELRGLCEERDLIKAELAQTRARAEKAETQLNGLRWMPLPDGLLPKDPVVVSQAWLNALRAELAECRAKVLEEAALKASQMYADDGEHAARYIADAIRALAKKGSTT